MTAPDAGGLPEPEFQNMRSALVRMLPDDPMQELCAEDLAISSAIETLDALRAEAERLRVRAEQAEAREQAMREALESVISEASWFVARKKNLAEYTGNADETWASVLDADLNIGRRTLRDTARAKLDAARKEKP